MLPPLSTPFGIGGLRDRIATLLPGGSPPSATVDVAEATRAGWLELWYQPKIHTRALVLRGAEALVRIRHPTLGGRRASVLFVPDDGDPSLRALSEFVIRQAVSMIGDISLINTVTTSKWQSIYRSPSFRIPESGQEPVPADAKSPGL